MISYGKDREPEETVYSPFCETVVKILEFGRKISLENKKLGQQVEWLAIQDLILLELHHGQDPYKP